MHFRYTFGFTLIVLTASFLFLFSASCSDDPALCPPIAPYGEEPSEAKHCCEALIHCCKQLPAGKEKDECLKFANQGGLPYCQSRYQELFSNKRCTAFTSLEATAQE